MARDFSTDIDKIREDYLNGMKSVLPDYFTKLKDDDQSSVDDLRKAIELGAKVLGIASNEKVENMPTISWTINGGVVQIGSTQTDTPAIDVVATTVEESSSSPGEPVVAPQPEFVTIALDPTEL